MPATQATDRVLIQAGHSAQFPPYRTGGGGAPGEAAWATDLAAVLAGRLRAAGVEVVCVGAWLVNGAVGSAPALVTDEDYDLFLSLHYDAAIYAQNTGCIVARAANDPVGSLADRFIAIWQRRYPATLGIPLHQERVNTNMTDYYAFRDTTAQTRWRAWMPPACWSTWASRRQRKTTIWRKYKNCKRRSINSTESKRHCKSSWPTKTSYSSRPTAALE
jgi:N-acetylmuramoyl-L-alanine amidase